MDYLLVAGIIFGAYLINRFGEWIVGKFSYRDRW